MYEPLFEKSWIHPCQGIFYYCIVLKVKAELKSFNVEQFVVKPVCNQRDNEGFDQPYWNANSKYPDQGKCSVFGKTREVNL